jgi:hypothetical protein
LLQTFRETLIVYFAKFLPGIAENLDILWRGEGWEGGQHSLIIVERKTSSGYIEIITILFL